MIEREIHSFKGGQYLVNRTESGTKIFICNVFGEIGDFTPRYSHKGYEPMDESIRKFKEQFDDG